MSPLCQGRIRHARSCVLSHGHPRNISGDGDDDDDIGAAHPLDDIFCYPLSVCVYPRVFLPDSLFFRFFPRLSDLSGLSFSRLLSLLSLSLSSASDFLSLTI